jgi:hypothetical protein
LTLLGRHRTTIRLANRDRPASARFTLENLTGLQRMPASGGWIVVGGPRNRRGSGAPSTIFGLTR